MTRVPSAAEITFSRAAAADLEAIDDYTLEAFGLVQAERLRERLREIFLSLCQTPLASPRRPEYDPPGKEFRYCFALQRWVIVYQPAAEGIRVARVLHGARELLAELERDAGA